jgi:polysaccharide pyruvyl transferase WcaK-like protein
MKICHLASYDKNIGDNAAIYNIRQWFTDKANIEWISYDLNNFYEKNNNIKASIGILEKLNNSCDAFVIGGGGLIEGGIFNNTDTLWKLPFNKQTLEYRGLPKLSNQGISNLLSLIDKSTLFSVRNDGSYEILKNVGIVTPFEIPDPGLIFKTQKNKKTKIEQGFFQPAMNLTPKINLHRKLNQENMNFLEKLCIENDLISMPHTPKDFKFFRNVENYHNKDELKGLLLESGYSGSLRCYMERDFGVVMRGHGQLISSGLNVPCINLSTQDKVLGFAMKNGYQRYTVDTQISNWKKSLSSKIKRLKKSDEYLSDWYEINEKNIKKFHRDYDEFLFLMLKKLKYIRRDNETQ